MERDRLTNLLGALALALTDAQMHAAREATGLSPSVCAAIVTLGQSPGETIISLSRVLGLTHSVTVRLVDGLVRDKLVQRSPGVDRRQVTLRLTPQGEAVWAAILEARFKALSQALAALEPPDRESLGRALALMLTELTCSRQAGDHICRLCDEVACGGDDCPVEQRAIRLEGTRR